MITPTVEFWFDLSATGGAFFTLDDPVKGKLDDTTYLLAGDLATDVTSTVRSVSIRRGRSRQLDQVQAGSCSVALVNRDRNYDPLHSGSPFDGNVVPGKRVTVRVGSVPLFDGLIDDWDVVYAVSGDSTASVVASDALARVAAAELPAITWSSQTSGARVLAVLNRDEVGVGANRSVAAGVETLQADTVNANTNALQYLQNVATTEQGRLFAAADGVLTFQGRRDALSQAAAVVFADDGTGVPFTAADVAVGSDLLYNRVVVTRDGGSAQTADDASSQAAYGVRALSYSGTLHASDPAAADMADYLVSRYGQPEVRVAAVSVAIHALSDDEAASVLALDLGDVVTVTWTPQGVGSAIDRSHIVEGIEHDIRPAEHRMTVRLGDADRRAFLILDDGVFGRLDQNLLAY